MDMKFILGAIALGAAAYGLKKMVESEMMEEALWENRGVLSLATSQDQIAQESEEQ